MAASIALRLNSGIRTSHLFSFSRRIQPWPVFVYRNFASNIDSHPYTPRRALLYVPADDERKLAKISSLKADCIVLECEDGVAITRKDEARRAVIKFLKERSKTSRRFGEIGVRVNSMSSGLLEEDIRALSEAQNFLQALMVPKVESVEDVQQVWGFFTKYCSSVRHPVYLVIWIESPRALLRMSEILTAAEQLRGYSPLRLVAAVLGSDDLCAALGVSRTKEGKELAYARQKFVMVCKAYGIQAIDMVFIDYKDMDGLRRQCDEASGMGFTGKQIIHPGQVDIVQNAFMPDEKRVKWARELLREFDITKKAGKGAFNFRGQMIDAPLVLQAQNIVGMADKIKEIDTAANM